MTDADDHIEQARTNLEEAIQAFLTACGDGRVLRDWVVGYSSVRFQDLDADITNYGYVFRNHQPLHQSYGLIDIMKEQSQNTDWTPREE